MYDYGLWAGLGAGFYVTMFIVRVLLIVAWWIIFEKAGEAGWKSIIPFYNEYILFKIAWGNGLLFLLMLIPIVNVIVFIILQVKLANSFGQSGGFAVGLVLLPNIFTLILGLGSAQYIGPDGNPSGYGGYQGSFTTQGGYAPGGYGQQGYDPNQFNQQNYSQGYDPNENTQQGYDPNQFNQPYGQTDYNSNQFNQPYGQQGYDPNQNDQNNPFGQQ